MDHSEKIGNLAVALSQFQATVPSAPFDSKNPFLKNRYASLGSIIETARPVLDACGLSVSQIIVSYDNQVGIETILMHSSGEWISNVATLPIVEEKGKSSAQVAGSIVTYLRRYSYAAILGMYAEEDTDGNMPEKKAPPEKSEKKEEHWTVSQDWKKFYTYTTKTLGLSHDEVHEALEVDSAKKFVGTKEEAFAKLNEYASAKSEAAGNSEDMLDEFFGAESDEAALAAIRGT